MRRDRRRLPTALAKALPFEPRERALSWADCEGGCRLVATTHGLWEWPRAGLPGRHCWREIDDVLVTPDGLVVRSGGRSAACRHVLAPRSGLPELAHVLDAGSRRLELAFTLASGTRVRIAARSCRFEGTLVWTSHLFAHAGADPGTDAGTARGLLRRVRAEYGTGEPGPVLPPGS